MNNHGMRSILSKFELIWAEIHVAVSKYFSGIFKNFKISNSLEIHVMHHFKNGRTTAFERCKKIVGRWSDAEQ